MCICFENTTYAKISNHIFGKILKFVTNFFLKKACAYFVIFIYVYQISIFDIVENLKKSFSLLHLIGLWSRV